MSDSIFMELPEYLQDVQFAKNTRPLDLRNSDISELCLQHIIEMLENGSYYKLKDMVGRNIALDANFSITESSTWLSNDDYEELKYEICGIMSRYGIYHSKESVTMIYYQILDAFRSGNTIAITLAEENITITPSKKTFSCIKLEKTIKGHKVSISFLSFVTKPQFVEKLDELFGSNN